MKKLKKCEHNDTESELIIQEQRSFKTYTLLQRATLIEYCPECEQKFEYVVAGGLLNVGHDST